MKKVILSAALVMIILVSLLSGSLAIYTKSVELNAAGVTAKEFIFLADASDSFKTDVKIAPTETVAFSFGVCNYDGPAVSETSMRYDIIIDVGPAPGKIAIEPLIVRVKDEDGKIIESLTPTGKLYVSGLFPLSASGQRHGYIIECYWPSTDNDTKYAGDDFGTQLNVSATAVQVTGTGQNDEPARLLDGSLLSMRDGYIIEYKGSYKNIIIPASVDGVIVKGIAQDAFKGKNLKSVSFEAGCEIESIEQRAFRDNNLTEIVLPSSVKLVHTQSFDNNPRLTRITIGANVDLRGNAFHDNYNFKFAYINVYSRSAGTYVYDNGTWVKQ